MSAININLYIPIEQEPVPLYIVADRSGGTDIANGQVPSGAIPLATSSYNDIEDLAFSSPYYFNDGSNVDGQYNYIFIPIGSTIDLQNVHVFTESNHSWISWNQTNTWIHLLENTIVTDEDGNSYIVYQFSHYDEEDEEWKTFGGNLAFQLI